MVPLLLVRVGQDLQEQAPRVHPGRVDEVGAVDGHEHVDVREAPELRAEVARVVVRHGVHFKVDAPARGRRRARRQPSNKIDVAHAAVHGPPAAELDALRAAVHGIGGVRPLEHADDDRAVIIPPRRHAAGVARRAPRLGVGPGQAPLRRPVLGRDRPRVAGALGGLRRALADEAHARQRRVEHVARPGQRRPGPPDDARRAPRQRRGDDAVRELLALVAHVLLEPAPLRRHLPARRARRLEPRAAAARGGRRGDRDDDDEGPHLTAEAPSFGAAELELELKVNRASVQLNGNT